MTSFKITVIFKTVLLRKQMIFFSHRFLNMTVMSTCNRTVVSGIADNLVLCINNNKEQCI